MTCAPASRATSTRTSNDDPRLPHSGSDNFTLTGNLGVGLNGYYYYLLAMFSINMNARAKPVLQVQEETGAHARLTGEDLIKAMASIKARTAASRSAR